MIPSFLKIKRLDHCVVDEPIRPPAKEGDVGYDLCANITEPVVIPAHGKANIGTGVAMEIEDEWPFPGDPSIRAALRRLFRLQGEIRPRSSSYDKCGLIVQHGTIDFGYRGELSAYLVNPNPEPVTVYPGDYPTQLVITMAFVPPIKLVQELTPSQRGTTGFGSTGGYSGVGKKVA